MMLAIVVQIGTTMLTRPENKRNPNARRAAITLRVNNENASGNATNPAIYHGSNGIETMVGETLYQYYC